MAFLGQEEQIRVLQERFRYVNIVVLVGLGILGVRLMYLQILSGDQMRRVSEENRIKRVTIPAPRGMIFDRERKLLVDNRPAFDLEITPQYLKGSQRTEAVLEQLASLINLSKKEIKALLRKKRNQPAFKPVKIKKDLSRDEVAKLETWKLDMPGVAVKMEIHRTTVYGDVASHLLGYIGKITRGEIKTVNLGNIKYKRDDVIGKVGVEKRFEKTLRGVDGEQLIEVDALGRRVLHSKNSGFFSKFNERPAVPGKNIVLTVDQDLQMAANKAFEDKAGAVVAIDPNNGEILAMVSRPSFNPTKFARGISGQIWRELNTNSRRPLRNKALQDHYSPGSVFKAVTAIAGLEDGVINENTKINCKGVIRLGRRSYHCHKRGGHGSMDVVQALVQSCDVFFYRVSQKLASVDRIAHWARNLGFGKKTEISLAQEVPGLVPTEAWKLKKYGIQWTGGETLSVAIGQGFMLGTGLQMANMIGAMGNGGTLYKPSFMKSIETSDGKILEEFPPEVLSQVEISDKTISLVKKGLLGVINDINGTAYHQRIPGEDFAGKTGTVQLYRLSKEKIFSKCKDMKYELRHNAMFVGMAPVNNPKIAVAVIGEHACHGSSGAAPIARAIIKVFLEKERAKEDEDLKLEKADGSKTTKKEGTG